MTKREYNKFEKLQGDAFIGGDFIAVYDGPDEWAIYGVKSQTHHKSGRESVWCVVLTENSPEGVLRSWENFICQSDEIYARISEDFILKNYPEALI